MTAISGPVQDGRETAQPADVDADRLDAARAGAAGPSADAGLSGCRASWRAAEARLRRYPPLVFAGEARRLKAALARGGRGQGLPAAGRRLRRELRRVHRQQHPRHVPGAAADGGGADLRRRRAGGEGRPHGRPVRQAALVRHRDASAASTLPSLPRRHHQRHRVHRRRRAARSRAHGAGLQPVGRDAEPAARLRPGRLCRPAPGAPLEPGFRRQLAGGGALPGARRPDRRDADLHGGLRADLGDDAADRARPISTPPTRRCCCPTSRR